jgi:hypothetical protein
MSFLEISDETVFRHLLQGVIRFQLSLKNHNDC